MTAQRFLYLLIAALLAISGAVYLSMQRNLPLELHGAPFLPYLAGEMDSVSALSILKGGTTPTVTLQKRAGSWTVKERGDFPADVPKLRKLLLALNDAKIVEEKTADPAKFPLIGVEDPSLPAATGSEISIRAKDGSHTVIIGKPVGDGNFARRGGENQSYSIEPAITFEPRPSFWIDNRLIDVAAGAIVSIEIKPAAGPGYAVHRTGTGDSNFVLDGVPPGRKAVDAAALAPSATTYSGLTAEDVTPAADLDFGKPTLAAVTLSNGNVVTLTGALIGDKRWVQIKMSKDEPFNARSAGRAFELTGYRYDAIFRPLEQLLVPKAPPPGAKKPSHAGSLPAHSS